MKRFIVAVLFVLSLPLAHAQVPPSDQVPADPVARQAYFDGLFARMMALQKRHTVTVRGDAMKRGAALNMFFQTLPTGGAPGTDPLFAQFAASRFGATGGDVAVLRSAGRPQLPFRDTCAPVLDGSLADGLSIAKSFADTKDVVDRANELHYQAVVNKLTPTVRAKVSQAVKDQAASMDSVNMDYLAMAAEDPELFKAMAIGLCRGKQSALARRPSAAPPPPADVLEDGLLSQKQN